LTADDMDMVDIVAMKTFSGYGVYSQRMLGNLGNATNWGHCQPVRLA